MLIFCVDYFFYFLKVYTREDFRLSKSVDSWISDPNIVAIAGAYLLNGFFSKRRT